MHPTLQPNHRQVSDLRWLLDLKDQFATVKDALQSTVVALSPLQLIRLIEQEAPAWTSPQHGALVRQGLALRGLMTESGLSSDNVIGGLSLGLEAAGFFADPADRKVWDNTIAPALVELLDSKLFRVAAKSANLAYDYANLLRNARVITDVRPVFDDSVESIDGAVVSHVLRLKYTGIDDETSLSIVIDTTDIQRLLEECERALSKGNLVRNWLRDGKPIQCHVTGAKSVEVTDD